MKFSLKLLLLFLVFFYSNTLFAQNEQKTEKTDSLLDLIKNSDNDTIKATNYIELINLTLYNNPDQAKLYIENSLRLYKKANNEKGIAKSYSKKATYFYIKSQKDSARYYLDQSIHMYLKTRDTLQAAVMRHNVGINYLQEGYQEKCIEIMDMNIAVFKRYNDSIHLGNAYLIKGKVAYTRGYLNIALNETFNALKIHENIKENLRIAEDMLQVGIIYDNLKEYEKAISFFEQSYTLYEELGYNQQKSQALNYLGLSNLYLKNFDLARESFQKALQLSQKIGYKANIARSYVNMGHLTYETKDYDKAIENFQKASALWKSISSSYNEANVFANIGEAYLAKKEYVKAIDYFDQSIALSNAINSPRALKKAYEFKSVALEKLNNLKSALFNYKKSKILSDTIYSIERTKAIDELSIIYETEKKEQAIVLKQNEIELLEQRVKVNNLQRLLLGSGIILLMIIFGLLWYSLRQKAKRSRLEKEKLNHELDFKKKELATHALHIAKKNEVLDHLKQKAEDLISCKNTSGYQQLIQAINFDLRDDNHWENFARYFEEIHKDFNTNIKQQYPNITSNELRLLALLKMNLSSKEIANMLNISKEGVKKARYRLRKKLEITSDESLLDLVIKM